MGQTWLNVTSSDAMLLSAFLLCDVVVHDAVGSVVVVYDFDKCGIGYDVVLCELILLQVILLDVMLFDIM